MSTESGAIVCPNPACHRKIEEPILLNNLSTTPVEQYYACPHCFIKLDEGAENEESAPSSSLHPSLEKVLNVISSQPQKEEEESPVKPPEKKEKDSSGCPHHFGYLASRAKDTPIPQECLICPKIVECMLKLK